MATTTARRKATSKATATRKTAAKTPKSASKQRSVQAAPRAEAPAVTRTSNGASGDRLGKGELRAQAVAHLSQHKGEEFTPYELGRVLGRKPGGLWVALDALANDPTSPVVQTSTKPRRYSIPKTGSGRGRAKR